jgi:hypothetical protein
MAMTVHNGLASGESNIESDIVPVRFRIFFDHPLTVTNQSEYRTFFLTGQVKEIRFMANGITSKCPLATGNRSLRA